MSKDNAKGAARPRQPETTSPHDSSFSVYVASLIGGGIFPPTGEFTLAVWARLSKKSEDTVRAWLDDRNVPYTRRFGDRYYDAIDINAASHKVTKDQDPDNARHGGKRIKKAT